MTSFRPPCNAPASAPRLPPRRQPRLGPRHRRRRLRGHSLRAGLVTYAHLRGASDRAIAHQTRHRSLATIGTYIRVDNAWQNNAATELGL
jgi:hypothetical protein